MNLFDLPEPHPSEEFFETLAGNSQLKIERIISTGQSSPKGFWYDQDQDEWVVLLQGTARLEFEEGTTKELNKGDWLLIPAHQKHRVAYTSKTPPCVWLAVFGDLGSVPG